MEYYITRKIKGEFDKIIPIITEELAREGFGIITTIDVQQTLKNKIGVDFRKYVILGACNPNYAYQALLAEDKLGVMLPCNVIVQEHSPGDIEVSAINPANNMQHIDNPELNDFACHITEVLTSVLSRL
jgi:uncharacterized protein (DUF302 family)